MALMVQMLGGDEGLTDREGLFDRCLRAAEIFWQVDNLDVFMPIVRSSEALELRSVLQSICLNVFNGTHDICDESDDLERQAPKLAIFHMSDWRTMSAREISNLIREVFPRAIICVVTGFVPLPASTFSLRQPAYDDARALLQAAGIGFIAIVGETCELSA
ncbi:hypothetical protein GC209_13155 [bacterium]|nr:hypothetical protein [bacterium]